MGRHSFAAQLAAANRLIRSGVWVWLLLGVGLLNGTAQAQQTNPALGRPALVAAGTSVDDPQSERWNRVVLLARPQIHSGDVDALPASIRSAVSSFALTILATVVPVADAAGGEPRYQLAEIGLGYSMIVDGQQKIVTVSDAKRVGASLSFVQRQMLSQNEKQLANVQLVARTSTLVIFDTPAILLRDEKHRDYIMRHFIWIDSRTGRNAALVWLLEDDGRGGLRVVPDEPLRWLPAGLQEERLIHVDGNEFSLLGIPSPRAFALEDLPPGQPVPWLDEIKQLAAEDQFDRDTLQRLTVGLNQALQALRAP